MRGLRRGDVSENIIDLDPRLKDTNLSNMRTSEMGVRASPLAFADLTVRLGAIENWIHENSEVLKITEEEILESYKLCASTANKMELLNRRQAVFDKDLTSAIKAIGINDNYILETNREYSQKCNEEIINDCQRLLEADLVPLRRELQEFKNEWKKRCRDIEINTTQRINEKAMESEGNLKVVDDYFSYRLGIISESNDQLKNILTQELNTKDNEDQIMKKIYYLADDMDRFKTDQEELINRFRSETADALIINQVDTLQKMRQELDGLRLEILQEIETRTIESQNSLDIKFECFRQETETKLRIKADAARTRCSYKSYHRRNLNYEEWKIVANNVVSEYPDWYRVNFRAIFEKSTCESDDEIWQEYRETDDFNATKPPRKWNWQPYKGTVDEICWHYVSEWRFIDTSTIEFVRRTLMRNKVRVLVGGSFPYRITYLRYDSPKKLPKWWPNLIGKLGGDYLVTPRANHSLCKNDNTENFRVVEIRKARDGKGKIDYSKLQFDLISYKTEDLNVVAELKEIVVENCVESLQSYQVQNSKKVPQEHTYDENDRESNISIAKEERQQTFDEIHKEREIEEQSEMEGALREGENEMGRYQGALRKVDLLMEDGGKMGTLRKRFRCNREPDRT